MAARRASGGNRADVDNDAAARLEHRGNHRPRAHNRADEIGGDRGRDVGVARGDEERRTIDAGVVDKAVDAAGEFFEGIDAASHGLGVADIEFKRCRSRADLAAHRQRAIARPMIVDANARPRRRARKRDRAADAATRSGHQDALALQPRAYIVDGHRLITSEAFCPPKANELEST